MEGWTAVIKTVLKHGRMRAVGISILHLRSYMGGHVINTFIVPVSQVHASFRPFTNDRVGDCFSIYLESYRVCYYSFTSE